MLKAPRCVDAMRFGTNEIGMSAHASMSRFHRVRLAVFGTLAVSYMLVFFHRIAPAVTAADLMRDFFTTATAPGSLAEMYYYTHTVMQNPAGVLAATLGGRAG